MKEWSRLPDAPLPVNTRPPQSPGAAPHGDRNDGHDTNDPPGSLMLLKVMVPVAPAPSSVPPLIVIGPPRPFTTGLASLRLSLPPSSVTGPLSM